MLERFNVVLAHLRRVQDGTRWIQCVRSMGDPEIKKLQEMVAMIPEDDFQSKKNLKLDLEKMWMVKNYLKTLIMMAKLTVAFLQDPQNTSHPQTLVTQVLKYHWFLPPRARSRRNGTL